MEAGQGAKADLKMNTVRIFNEVTTTGVIY
jgi:hypothetical protein